MPPKIQIDQNDTHRLIPARYAERRDAALSKLTDDPGIYGELSELDDATNERRLSESGLMPGIDARELVFGIPSYRIINAAYCHPAPTGSRFNFSDRGAWYAAFELETSQAEVAYHRRLWLEETAWEDEDIADYVDYLADFHAEFHDIRKGYANCLSPTSYVASQALGNRLLKSGSSGVVYPSVRQPGGTCIVCFRPVLVTNVRIGPTLRFIFANPRSWPEIRWF